MLSINDRVNYVDYNNYRRQACSKIKEIVYFLFNADSVRYDF